MLTSLQIRDFAIVDQISVEFGPGMTVLTGETGAGKSILVDALGLSLGDRASAKVVRSGSEQAEVIAVFELAPESDATRHLAEQGLASEDGECILRRTVGADGRSRAYINGRPAPLQSLRELGDLLVDIHGQHEHQSLLKASAQRRILDEYADHGDLLAEIASIVDAWQGARGAVEALTGGDRRAVLAIIAAQVGCYLVRVRSVDMDLDRHSQVGGARHAAEDACLGVDVEP